MGPPYQDPSLLIGSVIPNQNEACINSVYNVYPRVDLLKMYILNSSFCSLTAYLEDFYAMLCYAYVCFWGSVIFSPLLLLLFFFLSPKKH